MKTMPEIEVNIPRVCWDRLKRDAALAELLEDFEQLPWGGKGTRYRVGLNLAGAMLLETAASHIAAQNPRHIRRPFAPGEKAAFLLLAARLNAAMAVASPQHTIGGSR